MKERLVKIARWVLYPLFYVFALLLCFYLTFPWDKVKDRAIAEFDKSQQSKGDRAWKLEIGTLSGYWFSGVEITGAKIIIPPSEDDKAKSPFAAGPGASLKPAALAAVRGSGPSDGATDDGKPKDKEAKAGGPHESVMLVEKLHARVRLLPLLIGRIRIDFSAQAFGGEVHGTLPVGGGTLDVELNHVDLSQVTPLRDLVTVPVKGIASGKLEVSSEAGGKWSKATGSLDLSVADVAIGDGKAKLAGMATLPTAQLGKLEISGKATDGVLKFEKFGATGKDLDIVGDGYLRMKEPWDSSSLDLIIRFGFADAYRAKDDKTKSLLGDPADTVFPALIDQNPKMKAAKREDGLYGFRGRGMLKNLKWEPTQEDAPASPPGATTAAAKDADAAATKKKPALPSAKKKGINVEHDPANSIPPTREPSQPEVKGPPPPQPETGGLPTETAPGPPVFNPASLPMQLLQPTPAQPEPPAPTPEPAPAPPPEQPAPAPPQ